MDIRQRARPTHSPLAPHPPACSRRTWLKGALALAAGSVAVSCNGDSAGAEGVPSWVAAARPRTWSEVPMAVTLAAVDPIKNPALNPNFPGTPEWAENTGRQAAVVNAWCGAAFDETRDTYWLGLGGGHRDYAGNEIYQCDMAAERPAWRLVRPPSGARGNILVTRDGGEASGLYADGRPRATHGYNKWVYLPGVGPVLAAHGVGSWTAAGGRRWAVFIDEASGEAAFSAEPTALGLDNATGLGACYDPSRHALWLVPGNTAAVLRYQPPAAGPAHRGLYTVVGAARQRPGYASVCYLPGHDCLLVGASEFLETAGRWLVFDCTRGDWFEPPMLGEDVLGPRQGNAQPRWVPQLGAVCVWNNLTRTSLITVLKPTGDARRDPWSVSTLPVDAGNSVTPTASAANGTFGRFAHSPRLGGFFLFNATAGPTYFYKL